MQKKYVLKVEQYRLMEPRALDQILPLEKIDPLKNGLKQLKTISVDSEDDYFVSICEIVPSRLLIRYTGLQFRIQTRQFQELSFEAETVT